jgi:1-deoxy-D-xylulose-5-phosphate reductoisomerase
VKTGRRIALANKESIVMAGELVMKTAREKNALIIPVDSEHSAIFQCLQNGNRKDLSRILLTASGGPFFDMKRNQLAAITPESALAHPTWKMGARLTIDSATLMNKGFEVIEAVHLFGVAPEKIEVVVHRESIIHSMVEYNDNAVIAQLSLPDMRLCAQYALTYPERIPGLMGKLDLTKLGKLTFFKPDYESFPLLRLAIDCIKAGGVLPAALNAADEVAVSQFLDGYISFNDIPDVVEKTITKCINVQDPTFSDIQNASTQAMNDAAALCKSLH